MQYKHNMCTLSGNRKYIDTHLKTGKKRSPEVFLPVSKGCTLKPV